MRNKSEKERKRERKKGKEEMKRKKTNSCFHRNSLYAIWFNLRVIACCDQVPFYHPLSYESLFSLLTPTFSYLQSFGWKKLQQVLSGRVNGLFPHFFLRDDLSPTYR